ncbi:WYL domain-containing protein [bacterium]|nr:WYL domain-containing protein [bacterium]
MESTVLEEQTSQADRLKWLDEQLRSESHPNHESLAEEFNVTPAIAYRDLDFLKYILKAPLEYDYGKHGYAYSDEFELPEIKLTEGELVSLLVLGQLRVAYQGVEFEGIVTDAMALLVSKLTDHLTIDQESLDQILKVEIEPMARLNLAVFQELYQAIRNKESIILRYFSGQKALVLEKPCDPYHLLNYKDNWYLVAFCHEKQDFRDFLCSRILQVGHTNVTFLPDPDFSLDQHKKESQLFAAQAPLTEVVAEFDKYAAHWIRLKEVHPTQEIKERSDGSLEVSFKVTSMENITRWILSFGEHARILAPLELQERMRRTVGRMNYLYNRM